MSPAPCHCSRDGDFPGKLPQAIPQNLQRSHGLVQPGVDPSQQQIGVNVLLNPQGGLGHGGIALNPQGRLGHRGKALNPQGGLGHREKALNPQGGLGV